MLFEHIKLLLPISFLVLCVPAASQVTEVSENSNIYAEPGGESIGELDSGAKITKLSKDTSGLFIKASIEFYIPADALEESRIARSIGETQAIENASISLLSAEKSTKTVTVSVEIENRGTTNLDMSALMLFTLMDREGNPGNLEIMRSKNSVGIIKPGASLISELIYTFPKEPNDVEMAFQSKLGGEQVYFMLGF